MFGLNVWLIRHGQSASNAGLPTNGHDDVPLTELGFAQARAIAAQMSEAPALLIDSPFLRARATADAVAQRWPATPRETWPIQEITYLDPRRCVGTTVLTRQPLVEAYWQRSDPHYVDGPDAESFADFLQRVTTFHKRLQALAADFVVAIGHGQFFSAYRFALANGFEPSAEWMRRFRAAESATPLRNGEIIKLFLDRNMPYAQ